MALDVLFQATGEQLVQSFYGAPAFASLAAADASEANMFTATAFLDSMYGNADQSSFISRGPASMPVSSYFYISLCVHLIFICHRLIDLMSKASCTPSRTIVQARPYIPSDP